MIKPPSQTVRRIFEIDDGIPVTVEHTFVKEVAGWCSNPPYFTLPAGESFLVKASEGGCRSNSVNSVRGKAVEGS
jgi:hypothetical protein